ncbi:MAG: glycosyltransferase family 4 protein [bacterium]|nr:glycosyltransferase family 4 protein [bacterium]
MKIVFLTDDFPPQSFGGAGISTYDLARGMQKAGHEVIVITTCREAEDAGESEYQGLKIFKIASDYSAKWRAYLSIYNPPVIRQLRELLKVIKPDVVHVNNVHAHLSYHSVKLSKRYAKTVVVTLRDAMSFSFGKLVTKRYLEAGDAHISWLDSLKQSKKRWNPFRNLLIRYYLGYADKIFAVSYALQKALKENGIDNVEVIHTGLNISDWQAGDLAGKRLIFFGGRLSGAKGSNVAEQAMARVQKEIPEAQLFSGGSDHWLNRDEMRMAYAASDLVIVPSVCFDALPRTVLEAMASGRPVISTPYGGAKEIIENGQTGYIVNPSNIKELAEKMLDLLKNPEKAEKFGKAGRERIETNFNLDEKVKEYIVVYKMLI